MLPPNLRRHCNVRSTVARSWPRARLLETRGLGHHKILRSALVVQNAVEFIRGPVLAERAARIPGASAVQPALAV